MKKLIVLAMLVAAVAAAAGSNAGASRFSKATFTVENFTTQLQQQRIYWVGPDGVTYAVDRYYEFTASLSWSRFPPTTIQWLEIADPSKDQTVTLDVTGKSSYTFNGTAANGFWAFPGDSISFRLTVCVKPKYTSCLTYETSRQIPD